MKKFLCISAFLCLGFGKSQNYNVTLAGTLPYPGQTLANICGYVDSLGNEYALVGAANGMSIVDVTVPSNPHEMKQIPYSNTITGYALWKEIKVYKNYAYLVSEAGAGLQIMDLRHLPDTSNIPNKYYTGDGSINGQLGRVHALHIDTTKGFIYLFGSSLNNGGAVVCDIGTDPWNPVYAGGYNTDYIHDGYVDNDTLYGSHIYAGYFSIIDMTVKNAPMVVNTQTTPLAFTHNTWPSADKKTLFTTDEKSYSYLTSYDISNPSNITELDRIRTADTNSIVHNTHIWNNYAISSWYTEGFTIVDVSRPHNMIEVGKYDTYSGGSTSFEGAWGVYPFLPSGTIVVSNIHEGLFVCSPTYVRGCYLEGNVKDSITLTNIPNAYAEILSTTQNDFTNAVGDYATGTATAGTYNVQFSAPGYQTRIINNVSLSNGNLVALNVKLLATGVGIADWQNENSFVTVNGNPFHESTLVNYYLSTGEQEAALQLFDASGKLIDSQKINGHSGSIEIGKDLDAGLYFLNLRSETGLSKSVRLIKSK